MGLNHVDELHRSVNNILLVFILLTQDSRGFDQCICLFSFLVSAVQVSTCILGDLLQLLAPQSCQPFPSKFTDDLYPVKLKLRKKKSCLLITSLLNISFPIQIKPSQVCDNLHPWEKSSYFTCGSIKGLAKHEQGS